VRHTNPRHNLRNYLAQGAIDQAEIEQDCGEIGLPLRLLQSPFDGHPGMEQYTARRRPGPCRERP